MKTMICAVLLAAVTVRGADLQQSAYRSSVAQEDAQRNAEKIQQELGALIAEMRLNGFATGDMELLAKTSGNLANLSGEDMQKVIAALQNASASSEAEGQQRNLLTAYQGQKDIALKLQKLATEFTTRQVVGTIQSRLQSLTLRQLANARNTRGIKDDAKAGAVGAVVGSEESAIAAEVGLLGRNIQAALNQVATDATANLAKVTLDALMAGTLREDVDGARQLTVGGQYRASLPKQDATARELIRVMRAALAAQGVAEALGELQRQVSRLVAGEQSLMVSEGDAVDLSRQQARLQDGASLAEGLLKTLNATAAGHLARAGEAMQQSGETLTLGKSAKDTQAVAVKELQAALKLLEQQQLAAQQQQDATLGKQVAEMKALLDEVKKTQAEVQKQPDAKQADKSNQLAQQALATSPKAADNLFKAADQLQQDAKGNQQAAADNLGKAADQLQQQIDAAQQMAGDYQKLDQASQQLAAAQDQAGKAEQNLQQQGKTADAAQQLMGAQQQLSKINQQGLPEQAKEALQGAGQALKDAVGKAAQSKQQEAGQSAQQSQQSMQQAQAALAQAMQQMKQQAGTAPSSGFSETQPNSQDNQQSVANAQGSGGNGDSKTFVGSGGPDAAKNSAQVLGALSPKDREAIAQIAAQKIPQEYTQAVQQYLKNLTTVTDPATAP